MGNCVSAIREDLKTQVGDLSASRAELKERLDKQQKNVTSTAEQKQNIRKDIEATWRELKAQLPAVEARTRRRAAAVLGPTPLQ